MSLSGKKIKAIKKENKLDTLGNRLKSYEALSTSRHLMPNTPIYARIDGRAFHTFCRGLKKPYSTDFIEAMQAVCKFLVESTNACLGYVQSDEISLGWKDSVHAPFDGRVQKLESNIASIASACFVKFIFDKQIAGESTELMDRVNRYLPTFDCRVFNVPSLEELANTFLWRENDALKNSVSGMALSFYSHNQLQDQNTDDKVHMMRMKGYCFYEDTDESFMRGTFFQREHYMKVIAGKELDVIPEGLRDKQLVKHEVFDNKGNIIKIEYLCDRTRIAKKNLPYRLTETKDLVDVLFNGVAPECKISNPTFDLSKRN